MGREKGVMRRMRKGWRNGRGEGRREEGKEGRANVFLVGPWTDHGG